jgi:hypothetical protein
MLPELGVSAYLAELHSYLWGENESQLGRANRNVSRETYVRGPTPSTDVSGETLVIEGCLMILLTA